MRRTVTIHSVFVTAKLACLALNTLEDVLQCDKIFLVPSQSSRTARLDGLGYFLARTVWAAMV
jgi:hypothetical protein